MRSVARLVSVHLDDQSRIEAFVLTVSTSTRIAGLVRQYARLADEIVVRPMVVTMDPKFGLKAFNQSGKVRGKRGSQRVVAEYRLHRIWMRTVVGYDDGRARKRRRELPRDLTQVVSM